MNETLCPACGRHFISRYNESGFCRWCEVERGMRPWSPRPNIRPVVCIETGKVYNSVKEAERAIGASSGTVSNSIKRGWAAKGRHFRYLEAEDGEQ